MYILNVHQTHSGPAFSYTIRAWTIHGAKRAAAKHKDLLCYDGQGYMTLDRVVDVDGVDHYLPEATGSIPPGKSKLAWDN